jgi:hypothetical protein
VTSPGYPNLYDPTDPRQPPVQPGAELAGKYRIDRVIGAGAMGVVVQAWHIELEQQVAVKFLYPEFARHSDGAERFRREARAAAKIKNQHVARVLDVGMIESKGIPFIVMEYLEGRDLARELSERGRLPVELAVRYVLQACEAVAEAHDHGIVHRDLKPANLFLAEGPGGSRTIKVLDFGISKVNTTGPQQFSLTDTATLMGSPAYMSPEQLESSRNVDARADIWSLGVILHELVLGRVPFTGDSVPQLVRAILSGRRSTLMERDPGLEALEQVVARCLSQERQLRFESVPLLREALLPFAQLAPQLTPVSLGVGSLGVRGSLGVGSPGAGSPGTMAFGAAPGRNPARDGTELSGPGGVRSAVQAQASTVASPGLEAVAAPPAQAAEPQDPIGATANVPSAWGHTQRGRNRNWQRRLPLAAVLVLLALGSYWASAVLSGVPERSATSEDGASGNGAPAPEHSAAALGTQPLVTSVVSAAVPAPGAAPAADPSSAPPPDLSANTATPALMATGGAKEVPSVRVVDAPGSAPAAAGNVAPPKGTATTVTSSGTPSPAPVHGDGPVSVRTPPALNPAPTPPSVASPANGDPRGLKPAGSDKPISDKPKPDPSHHGAYAVPDFGGRE